MVLEISPCCDPVPRNLRDLQHYGRRVLSADPVFRTDLNVPSDLLAHQGVPGKVKRQQITECKIRNKLCKHVRRSLRGAPHF